MKILENDLEMLGCGINCKKLTEKMLNTSILIKLEDELEDVFQFLELDFSSGIANADDLGFLVISIKSNFVNNKNYPTLAKADLKLLAEFLTNFTKENNIK